MPSPRALVATPYRIGVLALVVVTVTWRAWTVSHWTWEDDDWLFIPKSQSMSLWSYLFQDHNGHFMPGGFLVTKAIVELAPLSFWPVVVIVSLGGALIVAVWGRAFEVMTGGNLLAMVPLSLVSLSPVMLRPMQWWAVSVNAIPLLLCLGLMTLVAARYAAADPMQRRRHLIWMALVFVAGLFFWHKCLFVVIPTTITLLALTPGNWRQRGRSCLAPLVLMTAIAVGYLAVFFAATSGVSSNNSVELTFSGQRPEQAALDFARGFSQMFLPAMLGGPWGSMPRLGHPYERQALPVTVVVLAITALAFAWLLLRLRHLLWLLVLPVAYVLITLSVVQFSTRARAGWDLMTTERYYTDGVAVGALTMALMLGVQSRRDPSRASSPTRRRVPLAIGTIVVSLLASNIIAASRIGTHPGRDWTANLRADVLMLTSERHPDQPLVMWDSYASTDVVTWGYWGDYAGLPRVLLPFSPDVQFRRSTDALYQVTDEGHIVKAAVGNLIHSAPGPQEGCGYAVVPNSEIRVPMSGALYSWPWGIRVTGFSETGGDILIGRGAATVVVTMPPGLSSRDIQYVGAIPDVITVSMRAGDSTFCLTDIFAGAVSPE